MTGEDITSAPSASASSLELASRNTDLAVQCTCMSADRTLMSVISASLALVGLGFTIAQVFQNFNESKALEADGIAARRVGIALVLVWHSVAHLRDPIPRGVHAFATPRAEAIGRGRRFPWRRSLPSFAHAHNRRDPSRDQRCDDHKHTLPHRPVLVGANTHLSIVLTADPGMTRTTAVCVSPMNPCSTRWR